MCLQHAACGGKDVDHWPRHGLPPTAAGDDVPLSVRAHAVQAPVRPAEVLPEYVQTREIAQRVFVSQGIGAEVSDARIVALYQVQCPLVRRHQQSVERRRPVGHALKCPTAFGVGVWIKPQHRAVVNLPLFVWNPAVGVGEPDTPFAVDGQVIGRVMAVAVQQVGKTGVGPVRVEVRDGPASAGAPVGAALSVEVQAVSAVGACPVLGGLA